MDDEHTIVTPLYSESEIRERLVAVARKLIQDSPHSLFFVCVLKGASVFHADLIREVCRSGGPPVISEFIRARSYAKSVSTGKVTIDGEVDVAGKEVIIIEDIVDTGRTATALKELLISKGAASVKVCTLLDKASKREVDFTPDYSVFPDTPDEFIVGYGLDFDQKYRELPYIGILHGNTPS